MKSTQTKQIKKIRKGVFVLSILFVLISLSLFFVAIPFYDLTGFTVASDKGCVCTGIRDVVLESDYVFLNGSQYSVMVEVFQGANTNPNQVIDSETVNFNSLPQMNIDFNVGNSKGNLIIERINQDGVLIRFHNKSLGRLSGDNTFRITINSNILGPDTIHLSCSQPIDIGDTFGDFLIKDIDKILKGSCYGLGKVDLLSPANSSFYNTSNMAFEYSVYDANQSIDYCQLIINESIYQTDYSVEEGVSQNFIQTLPNGTYNWKVNCTTSNGYVMESERWFLKVIKKINLVKGFITNDKYKLVPSVVNVYLLGDLVLVDNESYDFYLEEGKYDIEIKPLQGNFKELYVHNLTIDSDVVNFTRIYDSSEEMSRPEFLSEWIEAVSWEVNPLAQYDSAKINLSYRVGTGLGLWKCTNFDFDNQNCLDDDNWTYLYDVPDGPNEIVFNLKANDPIVAIAPGEKPPVTTLNYPPANFITYTSGHYNITFNCSAEDKQGKNKGIKNISLYLTNNQNGSFGLNETAYFSGNNTKETALFSKTLISGNYTWNCLAYDKGGNFDWADENRSMKIILANDTTAPVVTLIAPANSTVDNDGTVVFQYQVADNESDISSCSLIINNSVMDTDYSIIEGVSQSFSTYLTNGTYFWSVNCTNSFNLTGNSETRILIVNITVYFPTNITCCCGLSVSTTPEVVAQGDKVLVAADVSNLFTGLAATPADITDINVTIYRIENNTDYTIINNTPMTYLASGLWYYEFYIGNNSVGTYVASVTMLTNQTTPFVKEASDTFTVGEVVGSGLTIMGVSADLININETARLAAEIKFNGVAIDASLITNASLIVQQINGTSQMYTINDSLQVDDGVIYVDGAFNETGVYYLDWSATYLEVSRIAREIIVVVGWQELLEDINYTVNTELVDLIIESRQYLLELLTNMEYLQTFTEEEIFLITDSVNSMTSVVDYLETGKITDQEAEQQFNEIRRELIGKLGDKLTGSVIGSEFVEEAEKEPVDWRTVLFAVLLLMLVIVIVILLLLVRIIQTKTMPKNQLQERRVSQELPKENLTSESLVEQPETQEDKTLRKRRYEILLDKIKQKIQEKKNMKPENKKTL